MWYEKYYYKLGTIEKDNIKCDSLIDLSQIRIFDKKRLLKQQKQIGELDFLKVIKKLKGILNINNLFFKMVFQSLKFFIFKIAPKNKSKN